jgi:hypothetical protein
VNCFIEIQGRRQVLPDGRPARAAGVHTPS